MRKTVLVFLVTLLAASMIVAGCTTGEAINKPGALGKTMPVVVSRAILFGAACTDTDGMNENIGGSTQLKQGTKVVSKLVDFCTLGDDDVVEQYCDGDSQASKEVICKYGCETDAQGMGHCLPG